MVKRIILSLIAGLIIYLAGYVIGYNQTIEYSIDAQSATSLPQNPTFTGYDLFEAANEYRKSQGLEPFILHQPLCNNIAGRYQNYRENDSHVGLDEFVAKHMPYEGQVGEILAWGNTAEEAVYKWSGSPSHDLFLKNNTKACAYAMDGYSVMLLSN